MSTFITNKYDSINLVCVMMESAASYPMNRFQFSIRSGMESGIASIATSRYLYSMQGERTVYVISSSQPTTTRRPLKWAMLMVNFGVPSRRSLIVGSAQTAKSSTSAHPSSTSIDPSCSSPPLSQNRNVQKWTGALRCVRSASCVKLETHIL